MDQLTHLWLYHNKLVGEIPEDLGHLDLLDDLRLSGNSLEGTIPLSFNLLKSLRHLDLSGNHLEGSPVSPIRQLDNLLWVHLSDNRFSGSLPVDFGPFRNVFKLDLSNNHLSGQVPPDLGQLGNLLLLRLRGNDLAGPVPVELARARRLRELDLADNPRMTGVLPRELTAIPGLVDFHTGGTGLCAPTDFGFFSWLNEILRVRVSHCGDLPAPAYLVQAVQSRDFPVPLVAGKEALLRVFLTTQSGANADIPSVRARFYVDGREIHVEHIPGKPGPIPREVSEGDLSKSSNAEIPAHIIQPGLEMVIEVDPGGTLGPALGVVKRIPAEGRLAVDIHEMLPFDLTLIPFLWTETPDSTIVDLIEAIAADPDNHEMLDDTRTLLPIGSLTATAHAPVMHTSTDAWDLFRATEMIRTMEGASGYYMGMMSGPYTGFAGSGAIGGRWSFSRPYSSVVAHEIGHNLSLRHAPCGGAGGPDPSFPYSDGSDGAWGYDYHNGGTLVPPHRKDLMSYCGPKWISDYHFTNAIRFRIKDPENSSSTQLAAAPFWTLKNLASTIQTMPRGPKGFLFGGVPIPMVFPSWSRHSWWNPRLLSPIPLVHSESLDGLQMETNSSALTSPCRRSATGMGVRPSPLFFPLVQAGRTTCPLSH